MFLFGFMRPERVRKASEWTEEGFLRENRTLPSFIRLQWVFLAVIPAVFSWVLWFFEDNLSP